MYSANKNQNEPIEDDTEDAKDDEEAAEEEAAEEEALKVCCFAI